MHLSWACVCDLLVEEVCLFLLRSSPWHLSEVLQLLWCYSKPCHRAHPDVCLWYCRLSGAWISQEITFVIRGPQPAPVSSCHSFDSGITETTPLESFPKSQNIGYLFHSSFSPQEEDGSWVVLCSVCEGRAMENKCHRFSYHLPCSSFWLCASMRNSSLLTGFWISQRQLAGIFWLSQCLYRKR